MLDAHKHTHTQYDEENVVYSHHQIITATINYDQFVIYDFSLREKLLLAKCVYGEECVWIFLLVGLLERESSPRKSNTNKQTTSAWSGRLIVGHWSSGG